MSITKETRLESYISTETGQRRRMILSVMDKPLTARQIAHKLGYIDLNAVKPRICELKAEGKIEAIGKAYDEVTERNVAVYRRVKDVN